MDDKQPLLQKKIGRVNMAVFQHTGNNGSFYSVPISRRYYDKQLNIWKDGAFPEDELLNAAKAALRAKRFIQREKGLETEALDAIVRLIRDLDDE